MEREEEYITIKDATREYPFSRTTLYKLHSDNRLTFYYRSGKRQVLLLRSDLAALAQPRAK